MDDTWTIIKGDESEDEIHKQLLEKTLKLVDEIKNTSIKKLYEEQS